MDNRSYVTKRQVADGQARSCIWENEGTEAEQIIGVVLHNGESILFDRYKKHMTVYKVALAIAFGNNTAWWAYVPLAREVIRIAR